MPIMPVRKTEDLLTSSFVVHHPDWGKSIVFPGWGMDYNKTDLGSQFALPYGFDGNKSCYKQNGVVITGDNQLGAFVSLHGATDPVVRTIYLHATSKNAISPLKVKCRLYCFDAKGKILTEEEDLFWSRCRYVTSRLLSIERPINFSMGDGTDRNGGARYECQIDPGSYGTPLASEFTFSNDVDTVYVAFSHDSNTPSAAEPINLLAISSSALSMPLVTWLKDKQRESVTKLAGDLWCFPFWDDPIHGTYTLVGGFLEDGREIYNTDDTPGRPTGWRVVNRRNNTVISDATKGAKTLTVSSIDGVSNGDIVGYMRCDDLWDWTTVNGEPVGNTVTLADALSENVKADSEVITYRLVHLGIYQ